MKQIAAGLCLALVLSAVTVVGGTAPAGACSCVGQGDAESFARADAVFVGKLVRPGPTVWTFTVREVYKGKVTRTQEVVSEVHGASCGLELGRRGTFLVFGTTARSLPSGPAPKAGQLYATLCGGTRALQDGALQAGLAEPRPPSRGGSPRTPASSRGRAVPLLKQSDGANGEEALGGGVLRYDAARACVYLERGGGGRLLPQWPEGYHARRDPLRVYGADGALVAREGDFLWFSGGYHDPADLGPGTKRCGVDAVDGLFVMGHPAPSRLTTGRR